MKLTGFYLMAMFIMKAIVAILLTIVDVIAVVVGAIFSLFGGFCRMLQKGSALIVRKTFCFSDWLEDISHFRHE